MSSAGQVATALYTTLGLVALWLVVVWWRGYKTAKFRQDLFNLRAEIFDYARTGGVSFDSRSYIALRLLLNSMIRFAHELSFVRLMATVLLERFRPIFRNMPSYVSELRADPDISEETRKELGAFHGRVMDLVMKQLLTTSVLILPCALLYGLYSLLRLGLSRPRIRRVPAPQHKFLDRRLRYHIQLMEQQAIETRQRKLGESRSKDFAHAGAR